MEVYELSFAIVDYNLFWVTPCLNTNDSGDYNQKKSNMTKILSNPPLQGSVARARKGDNSGWKKCVREM